MRPQYHKLRFENGYTIVGVAWTFSEQRKRWVRALLRRWNKSSTHDWSELTYMNPDIDDFCMHCLGQKLVATDAANVTWFHCQDCKINFRFIRI